MIKASICLIIGFGFFGFLIGFITGLTSTDVSKTILTALFALIGGKLFLNLDSKTIKVQTRNGLMLGVFAIFCVGGIIAGIFIKVNHLLTIHSTINRPVNDKDSVDAYLRNDKFNY